MKPLGFSGWLGMLYAQESNPSFKFQSSGKGKRDKLFLSSHGVLPEHQTERAWSPLQSISRVLYAQIKNKASYKQQAFPEGMEDLLLAVHLSAVALSVVLGWLHSHNDWSGSLPVSQLSGICSSKQLQLTQNFSNAVLKFAAIAPEDFSQ